MKKRLQFYASYILLLLGFFTVIRILFLLLNFKKLIQTPLIETLLSLIYGLKLDISMVGYYLIFPTIILIVSVFTIHRTLLYIIRIYTWIIVIITSLLSVTDMALYSF